MHRCMSCRHGFVMRSPGSWLGGSRVSAPRLFCLLAPLGHLLKLALCCCFKDDPLRTGHTSCLVTTSHCRLWIYHSQSCGVVFVFGVLCWLVFVLCVFLLVGFPGVAVFCFLYGMVSSIHAQRTKLPFTALAPLAVINTASKHLHNDLARAIKALEQKKKKLINKIQL